MSKQLKGKKLKEYLWSLYVNYYEQVLHQMEKGNFSKVEIFKQRVMYEQRQDLFATFIDTYYGDEYEVIF
jgi:hypothetical protein